MSETPSPVVPARAAVVAAALELFDAGLRCDLRRADRAGRRRLASTFFRQFGGKDDVVFADHEVLLDELRD